MALYSGRIVKGGHGLMKRQYEGYTVVPFAPVRRLIVDVLEMGHRKHMIHGLAEVDVTRARQYIREYEATTGKDLSFTAFIVACLGKAVERNKYMHAYRSGRNHLVLFDEVDVNTQIEIEMDGKKVPIPHTIKAANKRTVRDIHQEIRRVQAEGEKSESAPTSRGEKLFTALPTFVRRLLMRMMFKDPHRAKEYAGTVLLTAVGMFGEGSGWGIPLIMHTLGVTLGGIAEKPVVLDGQIKVRECLSLTVSFDHDIIDGAPAARFTQRFKELIERGYGLDDQDLGADEDRA
jgi:pyruvate/2-oxoglutarate dehydrogenase complex dihydrolipoamide acyltransferase (E2) component